MLDDEQGRSGTRAEGHHGLQRLGAEGGLAHVGLMLGVERARWARASKDWHQRWELCALLGPLSADLAGIYAPRQYHERFLLGCKGTRREAERHLRRPRLSQGPWQQARRGALRLALPMGDGHHASGEVADDPEAQGPQVVRLRVRPCDARGTLPALWRSRVQPDMPRGGRVREGPAKGALEWRRPNRLPLHTMLQPPR